MRVIITYREINPNYSQEYADQYHAGEESENNSKYYYSKSCELDAEIDRISIEKTTNREVKAVLNESKEVLINVENMYSLNCHINNEVVATYSVSNLVLEKTYDVFNKKYNTMRVYFYLIPDSDFVFLTKSVCVSEKDINKLIHEN